MAFKEVAPKPTAQPTGNIWDAWIANGGSWDGPGLGGIGSLIQAPQAGPTTPTYTYAPPPIQQLPSYGSGAQLYQNNNAPWYVPTGAPGGNDMGGWDSSAFMQGLRALGYQGY